MVSLSKRRTEKPKGYRPYALLGIGVVATVGVGSIIQISVPDDILSTLPEVKEYKPTTQALGRTASKHPGSTFYQYPKNTAAFVPSSTCQDGLPETDPTPFMSLDDVQQVVTKYEHEEYALERKRNFDSIGKLLYQFALEKNQMLLTVQIGGMDGKTSDPMYRMFVRRNNNKFLNHWLPVIVEPVPANFDALTETYSDVISTRKLKCRVLSNWAVSYSGDSKCKFCHFDVSETAHPDCNKREKWARKQLGTLDCDYSRVFFGADFDKCIIQDEIPCGTIAELLRDKQLPDDAPIAMLQIDVEGYEHVIIPSLFDELPESALPPVIHFEHKVMRAKDELNGTKRAIEINKLLRLHGYILFDEGDDMLAIRVASRE